MLEATGEIFTVLDDLGYDAEPGILVQEMIGRLLMRCEVRPAGKTRQRRDLAKNITEPELPPPPPAIRLYFKPDEQTPDP